MAKFIRFKVLLLCIFIINLGYSQDYVMTIVPIAQDEGLRGNRVSSILQDQKGFIWMLTQDGVGRYDGHHYQWFNKTNSNLRGIPKLKQISEDAEGYIWLNQNDKIDLIHHSTFEVIHFKEKFKDFSDKDFSCKKISQGKNGSILFNILEGGKHQSYLYHPKTGFKELNFIENIRLTEAYLYDDFLWIKRRKLWEKYNLQTGEPLRKLKTTDNSSTSRVLGNHNKDYFFSLLDEEWILFEVQKKGTKELFRFSSFGEKELSKNDVILYDEINKVFISFIQNQFSVLDIQNQKLIPIKTYPEDKVRPFSKVFATDNQGIFWGIVGGEKGKVNIGKISLSSFQQYLPNSSIRGIWVNDKHIFSSKAKTPIDQTGDFNTSILEKGFSVETTIKDELWRGTSIGITNIYSEDGVLHPPILYSSQNQISTKNISWSILKDNDGRWWSGTTSKNGLTVSTSQNTDSLSIYNQYNEFKELKKAIIFHLVEDGEYIWAASNRGIYLIHKKKGVVGKYTSNAQKGYQLPLDDAHFIYKDDNNNYWVATNANGLVRFELDKEMKVTNLKTYTTADGLSSNVLYAIIEDDKKRLWISTLYGLTCFEKETEQIQAFFEKDGLPITEFNRISYAKGRDGRLYFGTIDGIIAFYPDEIIKKDTYERPLTITKFEKYEEKGKILNEKTIDLIENNKIKLLPSDRFIRLNVSLMDYFNAEQVRYMYKIEGLFEDFQFMDGNTIEIGGLPYGQYKLIIKGQGANRRFSKQELAIPLTVVRPYYLRSWFLVLILVMLIVSSLQAYFWRIRFLEERKRELEVMVKERTTRIEEQSFVLQERTDKIEQQALQLQELDKLKSKFFANISHELRTPLTLILAPIKNLFTANQLSNKQHTQLLLMQQNGQKLLKRINELLDLSRIDANKLEVKEEPTFLYPFFKNLLSTFESTANLKNIQLLLDYHLNENIQVLIDNDKIEKIVSNYLSNALKFTPKSGKIILKMSKENNLLQISVTDTGIGIPQEELTKIFDRFYQAQSGTDAELQRLNPQGTGIGLSLCQELAKVLKGRVWATSKISQGSTFYLELPIVESFAVKEEIIEENLEVVPLATTNTTTQTNRPTILIVEDNPDLRTYLALILEDQYNIITAENGQEALERLTVVSTTSSANNGANPQLATRNPQLIISDIMMPVMDGIELLTHLKASNELRHIPVIMLTARKSLEVKIEALRIGVDDYLNKPFTNEELIARISNLITNSQSRLSASPEEKLKDTPKVSATDQKWITEIENLILENIENSDFKLNDLTVLVNLSYGHIQRKIKQITGLSPKQYERSIKLAKARKLLTSGEVHTVSEVCYTLGFENHYYFSKIYKKTYGIMPSAELKKG